MKRARIVVLLAGLAVLAALAPSAGTAGDPRADYIVVLKPSAGSPAAVAADVARRNRGSVGFVYTNALQGFVLRIPPVAASHIAADSRVAYVEADGVVSADTTQSGATWGLDRLDQRSLPLSGSYTYNATASNVTAYVIDTGVRFSHNEFVGRATSGFDAVDGGSADDCNGHGTHVAGTIGGTTYGVAKAVNLVAVRVLNCSGSGTTSGVIAGIDWVTGNHAAGQPAVANMSLGGSASTALDQAVQASIADGVAYAIAAGNGNQGGKGADACRYSPARVPQAMTIGASDSSDTKPRWSNYGSCVDWYAPGVSITSAWNTSNTATNTISGTSMATPHTAGVAALYLSANPGATPQQVRDALAANTTAGVVKSVPAGTTNLLFTSY